MASHLTDWTPNAAHLFISDIDSLDEVKWISLGNSTNSPITLNLQSTYVLQYPSTKYPGTFIYAVYFISKTLDITERSD